MSDPATMGVAAALIGGVGQALTSNPNVTPKSFRGTASAQNIADKIAREIPNQLGAARARLDDPVNLPNVPNVLGSPGQINLTGGGSIESGFDGGAFTAVNQQRLRPLLGSRGGGGNGGFTDEEREDIIDGVDLGDRPGGFGDPGGGGPQGEFGDPGGGTEFFDEGETTETFLGSPGSGPRPLRSGNQGPPAALTAGGPGGPPDLRSALTGGEGSGNLTPSSALTSKDGKNGPEMEALANLEDEDRLDLMRRTQQLLAQLRSTGRLG